MMEAYINALLSSPVTHTVNVAGNAAFSMMRFMETGIAGVIGNTRQAIAKGMGMDVDPQDMAMIMDMILFMSEHLSPLEESKIV